MHFLHEEIFFYGPTDRQTNRPTFEIIDAPLPELKNPNVFYLSFFRFKTELFFRKKSGRVTRLGLQCQTPALSKVYFTSVGTIILGLNKFGSKNLKLKKCIGPKKIF